MSKISIQRIIHWQIRKYGLKLYYRDAHIEYYRCRLCDSILIQMECPMHGLMGKRRKTVWHTIDYKRAIDWVRMRDHNQCQWYNCGSVDNVQVHHIFPRSEYPKLAFNVDFMICYCDRHHKLWHEARETHTEYVIKYLKSYDKLKVMAKAE